jgi:hypothetical protein
MEIIGGQPSDNEIQRREAAGFTLALTPDGRATWVRD